MTVTLQRRTAGPYLCTGGETVFSYGFKIMSVADLVIYRLRGGGFDTLVYGIDYAVTGVGAVDGGDVVFMVPALADDQVAIDGRRAHGRTSDLAYQKAQPPGALNAEYDSLQIQIAELGRDIGRAMVRSPFDVDDDPLVLPRAEPNKLIGFDNNGALDLFDPVAGEGGGAIPDPLPVNKGGTGGNTAEEARDNLEALHADDLPDLIDSDLQENASERRSALGLGGLATRNTVDTVRIDDRSVTLQKIAASVPGYTLGFNEINGLPEAQPKVDFVRVTGIGRHANGAGGDTRTWIVGDDVYVSGNGSVGQNGMAANTVVPLKVAFNVAPVLPIVDVVSGGGSTFVIDSAGRVYAWGANSKGQLGLGDTTNRRIATRIESLVSAGVQIASVHPAPYTSGSSHDFTYFVTSAGSVYACGDNTKGVLGQGDTTARTVPTLVPGLSSIVGVAVPGNHFPHVLAWRENGQLYACGNNDEGQLGDGTTTQRNSFVATNVTDCASAKCHVEPTNGAYSVVRRSGGGVSATGANSSGQLGQGDTTARSAFTAVTLAAAAVQIEVGAKTVAARLSTGVVQTWGENSAGQTGSGDATDKTSPVTPAGAFQGDVVDIALSSLACWVLDGAGNIYAAGSALTGIGTGSAAAINSTFANLVGISGSVAAIEACGGSTGHGLSVLYDTGRAAVCGTNTNGELGHGTAGAHAFALVDVHLLNRHGPTGATGWRGGIRYLFSTSSTMADPGPGSARFNSGTFGSITAIALDALNADGVDVSAYLATWSASTSAVKGLLVLQSATIGDATLCVFAVTGVTNNSGWYQIAVTPSSGSLPSDAEPVVLQFIPTGNKGDSGSGLPSGGSIGEFLRKTGAGDYEIGFSSSVSKLGVNTAADGTNKLSVKSDGVLFSHDDVTPGTGDMRHIVNKAASSNTGALLFQTGFSGRAQVGLSGDDDIHIDVSPDGSTWHSALLVDKNTGHVSVNKRLGIGGMPGTKLHLITPVQYEGFILSNGTYNVAGFAGNEVGNDGGYFFLSVGGTPVVFMSATAGCYINANNTGFGTNAPTTTVHSTGPVRTGGYTVDTLPSAAAVGAGSRAFVTDATAATFGSAAVGGGANAVPVWSNGSIWLIG